jgi:putative ABC transport system permease protein
MKMLKAVRSGVSELTANKVRTLFMVLGVLIGITALTVIVSVGQGARAEVQRSLEQRLSVSLVTVVAGGGFVPGRGGGNFGAAPATLVPEDAEAIQTAIPNIDSVALMQAKGGLSVTYGGQSTTTTVQGVTPNYPQLRTTPVASGAFFGDEEQASLARVAVLGSDTAKMLFGEADPLGETVQIENVPFTVLGIVAPQGTGPGGGNLDDRIYIPQSTAARRLFNQTYLNSILVRVKGPAATADTEEAVKALLRERHQIASGMPDDFTVRISEEMLAVFTGTTQTLTLFLSIVAALSLLVGGFVLMNIMLISVSERKKEIGLRRAVGARRRDILLQFLLEAVIVTALGGALGVILGLAGTFLASRLMGTPAALSWPAVIGAVLFATLVGVVFAVQPARKAASLHPVEALRD